jgi:hypothetical protein
VQIRALALQLPGLFCFLDRPCGVALRAPITMCCSSTSNEGGMDGEGEVHSSGELQRRRIRAIGSGAGLHLGPVLRRCTIQLRSGRDGFPVTASWAVQATAGTGLHRVGLFK